MAKTGLSKLLIFIAGMWMLPLSCGQKTPVSSALPDPQGVKAVLEGEGSARLSWDRVSGAVSYDVFRRGEGDAYYGKPAANVTALEYVFDGLEAGKTYTFGVQALGKTEKEVSKLVYSAPLTMPKDETPVVPPQEDAPEFNVTATYASSAYIGIRYAFSKVKGTVTDHGICFGTGAEPTLADGVVPGPDYTAGQETMLQLVPSTLLEYGRTYQVRPYVTAGGKTFYGPVKSLTPGPEPEAIRLQWNKVSAPQLPSGIELYETTSPLNGRAFHAWYAIADCTGDVQFRVQYPSSLSTLETQFSDNCLVLINGSVFGGSGKSIGMAISDGQRSAWRAEADGQYWGNNKLMEITRATFGVDAAGAPRTCWSGLPDASHIWYYDRPLTTVAGEAPFSACSTTHPAPALEWAPRQAIAGGPMLLHDGKYPSDRTKSAGGFYLTNYDLWADDIYGTAPDRTAVGYTAEGKVVLFVCDGRISASQGAYIDEVARILKGIGCVGAVNLDGGGSTGMMVRGLGHINDLTGGSRKVCTTLGFFRK